MFNLTPSRSTWQQSY